MAETYNHNQQTIDPSQVAYVQSSSDDPQVAIYNKGSSIPVQEGRISPSYDRRDNYEGSHINNTRYSPDYDRRERLSPERNFATDYDRRERLSPERNFATDYDRRERISPERHISPGYDRGDNYRGDYDYDRRERLSPERNFATDYDRRERISPERNYSPSYDNGVNCEHCSGSDIHRERGAVRHDYDHGHQSHGGHSGYSHDHGRGTNQHNLNRGHQADAREHLGPSRRRALKDKLVGGIKETVGTITKNEIMKEEGREQKRDGDAEAFAAGKGRKHYDPALARKGVGIQHKHLGANPKKYTEGPCAGCRDGTCQEGQQYNAGLVHSVTQGHADAGHVHDAGLPSDGGHIGRHGGQGQRRLYNDYNDGGYVEQRGHHAGGLHDRDYDHHNHHGDRGYVEQSGYSRGIDGDRGHMHDNHHQHERQHDGAHSNRDQNFLEEAAIRRDNRQEMREIKREHRAEEKMLKDEHKSEQRAVHRDNQYGGHRGGYDNHYQSDEHRGFGSSSYAGGQVARDGNVVHHQNIGGHHNASAIGSNVAYDAAVQSNPDDWKSEKQLVKEQNRQEERDLKSEHRLEEKALKQENKYEEREVRHNDMPRHQQQYSPEVIRQDPAYGTQQDSLNRDYNDGSVRDRISNWESTDKAQYQRDNSATPYTVDSTRPGRGEELV